MGEDCRGCDYMLCIGRCVSAGVGCKMNFLNWKIWSVLASIFVTIAYGLKLRGDHYKTEAEEAKEEMQANDAVAEVAKFEAINAERAKQAEKESDEKNNPIDNSFTGDIFI